jgi:hypothetical protein
VSPISLLTVGSSEIVIRAVRSRWVRVYGLPRRRSAVPREPGARESSRRRSAVPPTSRTPPLSPRLPHLRPAPPAVALGEHEMPDINDKIAWLVFCFICLLSMLNRTPKYEMENDILRAYIS